MAATSSGDPGWMQEGGVERARRVAEAASAQARAIARRAEKERTRRRWAATAGCAAGVVGMLASASAILVGGRWVDLWWLLVPAWILGTAPILVLAGRDVDVLSVLAARAAGTASVAEGICRSVEAAPSGFEAGPRGTEVLGLLAEVVDRDIEGARRALHARAGGPRRRHRRIVPRERRVSVTTHDGRSLRATIADLSRSGVSVVEALPRLERGQSVVVGRTWARVARAWGGGVAFEFEAELDPSTFDEGIVL